MTVRRFAKPLVASLLAAGLFGLAAGPAVSAPLAEGGSGAHTNDTGWGRK